MRKSCSSTRWGAFREIVGCRPERTRPTTDDRRPTILEENGFTLPEVLVTTMVMLIVMAAIYSVFDMSVKIFMFGNDKVEAVENARLGLEKMEREIRAAHPFNGSDSSTDNDHLFFETGSPGTGVMPSETRITFGNDLNFTADGKVECDGRVEKCEFITYKLVSAANSARACTASSGSCTLRRVNTRNSFNAGDPIVEFVEPGGLTFAYLEGDGTTAENEAEITRVQVRLQIDVDGSTQSLTTSVDLRNRTRAGP